MRAQGVGSESRLILLQNCTVLHGEARANVVHRIGGRAVDERGFQAEEGVRQDSPATPITAQAAASSPSSGWTLNIPAQPAQLRILWFGRQSEPRGASNHKHGT